MSQKNWAFVTDLLTSIIRFEVMIYFFILKIVSENIAEWSIADFFKLLNVNLVTKINEYLCHCTARFKLRTLFICFGECVSFLLKSEEK